jgi:hypothetical protein
MSKHLGDYDAATVVYGKFTTYQPSTGASFTLAGSPAIQVYKDNSTTQSSSGVTLTTDFDSVTGFNHFAVDTSSDGTFYSAGSFFDVMLSAGSVNSVNVAGSAIASFTLRKDSALKPATAGRNLVVDTSGLADATTVKLGPSGSASAQTARDVGASVLLSSGTGTGQLNFTSGVVDANTTKISGTAQTARDLGASVLLSSGTGTGQLSLSSGRAKIQSNTVTNTAINGFQFVMRNTAGTPTTGLTVTASRSIDGGAFSSCANSVTEIGSGFYKIDLATSDVNGVCIAFKFSATGANDTDFTVIMTP